MMVTPLYSAPALRIEANQTGAIQEVHKKLLEGKRDGNCFPKIGSINPGRGSDNCCADVGCRPWSCGKCKGGHAIVDNRVLVIDDEVAEAISDGKEVKVVIQQTATNMDQVKRN